MRRWVPAARPPATVTHPLETVAALELLVAPAPARAGRLRPLQPASRPWKRTPAEWQELAPRGLYARRLRTPFLWCVTLALVPLALVLAVPIVLVNAFIHGSPRRVLFAQLRVGWRGRVFVLLKFRTLLDRPGDDHARATRCGRFLRNTHLDELPQLWNVLTGDMCLIGPRPEMLSTERWAATHCPGFSERLALKPGLTGLAQITQGYTDGGDQRAYNEKHALNQRYRHELGFLRDCAILARTVLWMLRGRGWRRR